MTFAIDLAAIKKDGKKGVDSITYNEPHELHIAFNHPTPSTVILVLPDGFVSQYPHAVCTYGTHCLAPGNLHQIINQVHEMLLVDAQSPMGEREWTTRSQSDQFYTYPTADMHPDDIAPMNPQLVTDIDNFKSTYGPTKITVVEMGGPQQIVEVVLNVNISEAITSDSSLEALGIDAKEQLQVRYKFHRQLYLEGDIHKVEVGQARHFRTGNKKGLPGQMERILTALLRTEAKKGSVPPSSVAIETAPPLEQLIELGFDEAWATKALGRIPEAMKSKSPAEIVEAACRLLTDSEIEDFTSAATATIPEDAKKKSVILKKRVPQRNEKIGLFVQAANAVLIRAPSLAEFCVICDRPHLFGAGMMLRPSVCSRQACLFSFQTFSVGADAASEIATELGVVDLLWCIAAAASKSSRWELIFNPFPVLFDPKSTSPDAVVSQEKKNIDLVKGIFDKFPPLLQLSQVDDAGELRSRLEAAHPLGYPLLQWIISNNRAVIRKMPKDKQIDFMGTPHQYYFFTSNPERERKFNDMKAKFGTEWAFHGSRAENWHSILHNGIRNASGTNLQLNGTAYGNGIYTSPHASVSFQYSNITKSNSTGKDVDTHESQFIEPSSMLCIAIVEVVKKDTKKSGNIWVQPLEECVMTRFLLVYTRGFSAGSTAMLDNAENTAKLDAIVASMK